MKFITIGLWITLFLLIAPAIAFGQDGSETDEDHCQEKYNAFREHRDKLQDMSSSRLVDYACWEKDCAELELFNIANHAFLAAFSVLANHLADLIPFPDGNSVPFPQSQAARDLENAYHAAVEAGYTTADDILNAILESTTFSDFFKNALKELLPPDFDALSKELQDQLDADEKRECLEDAQQEATQALSDLDAQWKNELENFQDSVSEIIDVCDPGFHCDEPSPPDCSCSSTPKPKEGECRLCEKDPVY